MSVNELERKISKMQEWESLAEEAKAEAEALRDEIKAEMLEINIGAGTLSRPIENVCATLLHEMVHYFNYENGIQDTSRGGTYHNKRFKTEAEARGLIVAHSEKYGWSHTSPSDELLDFVLMNGLTDILITRNEFSGFQITGTGTHSGTFTAPPRKPSSTRKYICPCCGMSVRATRTVRIACMDCSEQMIEV